MTDKIIKKTKKGSYDSQTVFITEYKRRFNNEIVVQYHNFSNGRNYDTLEELLNDPERDRNEYCIFLSRYNTYRETYQHNINLGKKYPEFKIESSRDKYYTALETVEVNKEKYLILYYLCFESNVPVTFDEKRSARIISSFVIDKDKNIYNLSKRYPWDTALSMLNVAEVKHIKNTVFISRHSYEALSEMGWGVVSNGGMSYQKIYGPYTLYDFLAYKEPVVKPGKKQDKVNELTSYNFKEITMAADSVTPKDIINSSTKYMNIQVVDCTISTVCCRIFFKTIVGSSFEIIRVYAQKGKIYCCRRLTNGSWFSWTINTTSSYILRCVINEVDKECLDFPGIKYMYPEMKMQKDNDYRQLESNGLFIIKSLEAPYIETLYKGGFKEAVILALNGSYLFKKEIERYLGPINTRKKGLYDVIGLSKNQISMVKETEDKIQKALNDLADGFENYEQHLNKNHFRYGSIWTSWTKVEYGIIDGLKAVIAQNDIRNIDDKTIRIILNYIYTACIKYMTIPSNNQVMFSSEELNELNKLIRKYAGINIDYYILAADSIYVRKSYWSAGAICRLLGKITSLYSLNTTVEMIKSGMLDKITDHNEYEKSTFSSYFYHKDYISEFSSIISMTKAIREFTDEKFDIHISKVSDLQIIHDDLYPVYDYYMEVKRQTEYDKQMEKISDDWDKRKKSWKKWEYKDDIYSVIIPETPMELSKEGSALVHCVGGYINRVLKGITNILFIRRNEALGKSLFTVEMSNSGVIEQIHGYRNCNITDQNIIKEEPEINTFIHSWINDKKLIVNNFNKVR